METQPTQLADIISATGKKFFSQSLRVFYHNSSGKVLTFYNPVYHEMEVINCHPGEWFAICNFREHYKMLVYTEKDISLNYDFMNPVQITGLFNLPGYTQEAVARKLSLVCQHNGIGLECFSGIWYMGGEGITVARAEFPAESEWQHSVIAVTARGVIKVIRACDLKYGWFSPSVDRPWYNDSENKGVEEFWSELPKVAGVEVDKFVADFVSANT